PRNCFSASTSRTRSSARTIPISVSRHDEVDEERLRSSDMSIYVEILIRVPMDALWAHTQTPALDESWPLRFSRIDYLPRALDTEPQRFRYATKIAFGFEVSGEGETAGQR